MNVALGVGICDTDNEAVAVDFEAKFSKANFGSFHGHNEIRFLIQISKMEPFIDSLLLVKVLTIADAKSIHILQKEAWSECGRCCWMLAR